MLFLFTLLQAAFATCAGGAPACVNAYVASDNYCLYYSGPDKVQCNLGATASGINTVQTTGTGAASGWDVTVGNSAGYFCCDESDFATGADVLTEFAASALFGGPQSTIDFSSLSIPTAVSGYTGNDTFYGGSGADSFNGYGGDDYAEGNGGADILAGGADSDYLDGGPGGDTLCAGTYELGDCVMTGTEATGAGCNNILIGGLHADYIVGSSETGTGCDGDWSDGGSGTDTILGLLGADTLCGGADDDDLDGGPGNDILFGGTGSDTQEGGAQTDDCENDGMPTGCETTNRTSCPSMPSWP